MSLPQALLVQVERLSVSDNEVLRHYNRLHGPLVDVGVLATAINRVVDDRLAFAGRFVESVARLARSSDPIDHRNSVSRSYYAVHHAMRALVLFVKASDPYGHETTIERFEALLSGERILSAKFSRNDVIKDVAKLLHHRHLADYYIYGSADPREAALNFASSATEATEFASWFVEKAEEFVTFRRFGA